MHEIRMVTVGETRQQRQGRRISRVFQPMCGTGRSGASVRREALPGMIPRQRASPSCDASYNSCIPRQIPSTGCSRVGIRVSRRFCRSRDMASAAAPTRGV